MNFLQDKNDLTVLAIESSCDETACAILRDGELLSSVISSQVPIHRRFGGVVPEIASRNHVMAVGSVVKEALDKSGLGFDDIDAIAVTYGAGLLGALLVGLSYAKGLAYALNKPLIGVSHIHGHVSANHLEHKELVYPYVTLIVSGGHTALAIKHDSTTLEIVGSTGDDAVGEAFDKVARVLGLPYPGGPEIEKLAREGKSTIALPKVKTEGRYDFSYSGLKTFVINYVHNKEQKGEDYSKPDLASSFQDSALTPLADKAIALCEERGIRQIAIAGGVGANGRLREIMNNKCMNKGIKAFFPSKVFCTDNAAMIGMEATMQIRAGREFSDLSLDAKATVKLSATKK